MYVWRAYARGESLLRGWKRSWTRCWSRARRPFSLAGWGLHLASNGINNPNHHIGPVWAGRTPPRCTVSIIPGASEPCPQSCHARLIDMDPYRAHVVARMLMACFLCFPARIPKHHTSRINTNLTFVLAKGKPQQSTNLPIPSNECSRSQIYRQLSLPPPPSTPAAPFVSRNIFHLPTHETLPFPSLSICR
jgi:hypothetical protein